MRLIQKIQNSTFERHVHVEPYAAVVLSGGYEEAGDSGRFEVETGSVVFHDWFEAHRNRFSTAGATVLNLPLPAGSCLVQGLASVPDPDLVVRTAERSRRDAADLLVSRAMTKVPDAWDWPDELAARINVSPCLKLSEWGEQNGLAGWTISRGFQQVFGVSPEAFRARVRTRRALRSIRSTKLPLANIAAELGFSDQAHMTRSVKQLTGKTPQAWRALQMDSIQQTEHSL